MQPPATGLPIAGTEASHEYHRFDQVGAVKAVNALGTSRHRGGTVRIDVVATGVGIAPQDQDRVCTGREPAVPWLADQRILPW